jgi:hypothetical protein
MNCLVACPTGYHYQERVLDLNGSRIRWMLSRPSFNPATMKLLFDWIWQGNGRNNEKINDDNIRSDNKRLDSEILMLIRTLLGNMAKRVAVKTADA